MVESFVSYMRLLHFALPDASRRYYRLFGDLEYDLSALRAETGLMTLRLREVKRRIAHRCFISEEDERRISVTSHELTEDRYESLDELRSRISSARNFRFDAARERQAYFLLNDIAHAILGIGESLIRSRELDTLDRACEAYGRLDLAELFDIHEHVQPYLAHQRRDHLDAAEEMLWRERLETLSTRHPLRYCSRMDDPAFIKRRIEHFKRAIAHEQDKLERLGMSYTAAVRAARYRN